MQIQDFKNNNNKILCLHSSHTNKKYKKYCKQTTTKVTFNIYLTNNKKKGKEHFKQTMPSQQQFKKVKRI